MTKEMILKKAIAKVAEIKETTPSEIIELFLKKDDWIVSLVLEAEKTYSRATN